MHLMLLLKNKFLFRKGVLSELVSLLMELSCQYFLVTPHTDTKVYSDTTKNAFYSTLSKAIKNIKLEHPSFKLIVAILMLLLAEIVNHINGHLLVITMTLTQLVKMALGCLNFVKNKNFT